MMKWHILAAAVALAVPLPASATTYIRQCTISAAGDACIFDVRPTSNGTLTVSTKAFTNNVRWRTVIAKHNTTGVNSGIGNGSTTAYSGSASRAVTASQFNNIPVYVLYERPLPGSFPTCVEVRFVAPAAVVSNMRPTTDASLPPPPPCLPPPP